MLCVLNSIALKKILMNIFFSTFTILANHRPAYDTINPALEVRPATVKPTSPKSMEPKPAKAVKSVFNQDQENSEFTFPADSPLLRRKTTKLPLRKI
jgi:hypothetical protein